MTLTDLKIGEKGTIVSIEAGKTLKRRLASFGIYKGSNFEMRACSMNRSTFELQIGSSCVALRRGEAEKIEVEKVEKV